MLRQWQRPHRAPVLGCSHAIAEQALRRACCACCVPNRARSLGLFLVPTSPPLWSGAGAPPAPPLAAANGADQHTKLSAWTAFRGRAPSPIEHAPTLLLSGSSDGSGGAGQPDASPAARAERDGDAAGAEGGAAARRRRWRQQRAAALGVAWGPPAAGRAQSRVTEAAVQERAPVLDVLSGARMQPHTAAWSVEAVDGSTATSQFEEDVLAVPAQPQTILMLKRAWLGVCPVAGVPWKRVRAGTAAGAADAGGGGQAAARDLPAAHASLPDW